MLKRIRIFALIMAVAVICVSVLPACRNSAPEDESYDSYVYCLNADRTGLVKVEYGHSRWETAGTGGTDPGEVKTALDDLECVAPIPEDVEVLKCVLNGSIWMWILADSI